KEREGGRSESVLELLFTRERTETIEVRPATTENLLPVRFDLEVEFLQLTAGKAQRDYIASYPDPADEFMTKISGCRHKEFVPLLLRSMDRVRSSHFRSKLAGMVYECF